MNLSGTPAGRSPSVFALGRKKFELPPRTLSQSATQKISRLLLMTKSPKLKPYVPLHNEKAPNASDSKLLMSSRRVLEELRRLGRASPEELDYLTRLEAQDRIVTKEPDKTDPKPPEGYRFQYCECDRLCHCPNGKRGYGLKCVILMKEEK